jgi:uncharacterized repeat protein (TIGR03803 family)
LRHTGEVAERVSVSFLTRTPSLPTVAPLAPARSAWPYGCGVIYKLDFSGNLTILHTFTGADGTGPHSVVLDPAGNLYGNTYQGGIGDGSYGSGVIFKVDKGGTFSVVYDFDCSAGTGCFPEGALLLDRAGHIYGTTCQGGARQTGLVYKISQ